ncbi:MAG: hypothetical protein K0R15_2134 [Clostridiales bacterium]|jgi:radical SAM protein (TIGR01212 family)|nr:hypothetical protein [Clostridiales bacterium]
MKNGERYNSLNSYLREKFGDKVYRVSIDGGFTCPNRDGSIDSRGCIFCSAGGSGDFAEDHRLSITEQINSGIEKLSRKTNARKFIAYFQAFTNTYSDIETLKSLYFEAIQHPQIVALSIATRPDCMPDEVIELLSSLNAIKPTWVELGLQTTNEQSTKFIRRGYQLDIFDSVVHKLNLVNIDIIVHLIIGLPYETNDDVLNSIHYIANKNIQGVKLQLLHILKGTDLATLYENNPFAVLTKEQYVELIVACLERLPDNIVIHRLTGDGPRELLIAPLWSTNKKDVLNSINKQLKQLDTYQGRYVL